jgi:tRNA threonylcarbamoyladenosine biosynthesis protein TsaB
MSAAGAAPLLAVDTASPVGSVAVGTADRILSEVTLGVGTRHSEALMPAVRFALEQAGIGTDELGGVVVGAGPGSFTGVRIAAATAKGLARGLRVPLHAYSSLLALAATVAQDGRPVCALLDARRGEVYAACYRFVGFGRPQTLLQPVARDVAGVVTDVAALRPVFAGEGALRYRDRIGDAGAIAPAHLAFPRAAALLWLAAADPASGRVDSPARWSPDYLRASGAERTVRS